MSPTGRTILIAGLLACLIAVAGVVAVVSVFSIGTAAVTLKIEATVYDRKTRAPVPGCLLAFEIGEQGGYGQTSARSDARGQSSHETHYSYVRSLLWPFARNRDPKVRFYLREAPRYGTYDEVEAWDLRFRFREPWSAGAEVRPRVEVQRFLVHEEVLQPPAGKVWRPAGSRPSFTDPASNLVSAALRVGTDPRGRKVYEIPLSIYLDDAQIAVCREPTLRELEVHAVEAFNAGRYEEAIGAYRDALRISPDTAWAFDGLASSLGHLDRMAEAVEAHRRAVELEPEKADFRFAYGNTLLRGQDRYEEAVEQFRKLTTLEPGKARGFIGLAGALHELRRYREAVETFDRALKICPTCLDDGDREVYAYDKSRLR
jgi:tetratricopeptide (TPR) repeat protein